MLTKGMLTAARRELKAEAVLTRSDGYCNALWTALYALAAYERVAALLARAEGSFTVDTASLREALEGQP